MVKDYYQILEVERDVSPEEMKKSYHSLAHQWHPDKNPDNIEEAEEKFKDISEAYSVLSDPEKKQSYDMTGSPNGQSGGFRTTGDPFGMFFGGRSPFGVPQKNPPMRGQSIQIPLELNLHDALFGSETSLEYEVTSGCSACEGRGGTDFETCPDCAGSGFLQQQQGSLFIQRGCDRCSTQGQVVKTPCVPCKGRGLIMESKRMNIVVPPGMKQGNNMRLTGQGGAGFNGGPRGDVMIVIQVKYPDISSITAEEKELVKRLFT